MGSHKLVLVEKSFRQPQTTKSHHLSEIQFLLVTTTNWRAAFTTIYGYGINRIVGYATIMIGPFMRPHMRGIPWCIHDFHLLLWSTQDVQFCWPVCLFWLCLVMGARVLAFCTDSEPTNLEAGIRSSEFKNQLIVIFCAIIWYLSGFCEFVFVSVVRIGLA